jgi:hypothetical protein
MSDGLDLEQRLREEARWRILRVVDAGRPVAVCEQIVWRVLTDIKLGLSLNQVRRELSYLRDLGLLELEGEESDIWSSGLHRLRRNIGTRGPCPLTTNRCRQKEPAIQSGALMPPAIPERPERVKSPAGVSI